MPRVVRRKKRFLTHEQVEQLAEAPAPYQTLIQVTDGRVTVNAAAAAKAPTGGQARREGSFLDLYEVVALAQACRGPYAELV